ncbi:MAG TPA: hypothetical protein VJ044_12830 [Candidatus Hodarchaeales archaeon]|nr:hypothetical protein [Candidatus Hodarchaeales archaeon]
MVYRIVWSTICMIRYTLLDFVMPTEKETIDCRTVTGQQRYIELFGCKAFYRSATKFLDTDSLPWVRMETYLTKNGIQSLFRHLTERSRRIVAAFLAITSTVRSRRLFIQILGVDWKTIQKGIQELSSSPVLAVRRIRQPGGGRKAKDRVYPQLVSLLEGLSEDHLAGDPMNEKRWVRKSLRYFKLQLGQHRLSVSLPTIKKYLRTRKISLKGTVKQLSTRQHAQRDLQFQQIAKLKHEFLATGKPVISIDTKKKEQLGLFKSIGDCGKKLRKRSSTTIFPR